MAGMLLLLCMLATGGDGAWQVLASPSGGGGEGVRQQPALPHGGGWGDASEETGPGGLSSRVAGGGERPRGPADPLAAKARTHQAVRGEGGLNGQHCAVRPKSVQGGQQPGSTSRRGHVPCVGKQLPTFFGCSFLTPLGGSESTLEDLRGGCFGCVRVRPLIRLKEHSVRWLREGREVGEERCTLAGGGWERAGGARIGASIRSATAAALRAGGGDGSGLGDRTSSHRARRQGGEGAVWPASLSTQHGAPGAPRW